MQSNAEIYLTRREVAQRLKISTDTIIRWVKTKGFPELSLGKNFGKRYRWNEVQNWLDSQGSGTNVEK